MLIESEVKKLRTKLEEALCEYIRNTNDANQEKSFSVVIDALCAMIFATYGAHELTRKSAHNISYEIRETLNRRYSDYLDEKEDSNVNN